MRLLTRADFDGLACAALLAEKGIINEYFFVHPREIQAGKITISEVDVLANVPYVSRCGLWFAHHSSEAEQLEGNKNNFKGDSRKAPSTAQVIWDYYGGVETFGDHFLPLLEATNQMVSADLTLDEILLAEEWILLAFIIDPRTGIAQMDDYRISNDQFFLDMIDNCRTKTIKEILKLSDVQERTNRYNEQQILFKDMLRRCSRNERNVVITDLLSEETIYCGNRFIIFASHPDQNIEIRLEWDEKRENVSISCGHSILNRTSRTDVGNLMLKYNGGGHEKAGSCRVSKDQWQKAFDQILEKMRQDR
ncbi:MAG: exopolyphosphatase [SAR324 cluster bacterium]|nr:exopolyphosphatase [SAR324 cluster bacterium]